MTAKIMKEAREQNEDLEAEENVMLASARNHSQQVSPPPPPLSNHTPFPLGP